MPVQSGVLSDESATTSINIDVPFGDTNFHIVEVTVTDANGNEAVSTAEPVDVTVTSCFVVTGFQRMEPSIPGIVHRRARIASVGNRSGLHRSMRQSRGSSTL